MRYSLWSTEGRGDSGPMSVCYLQDSIGEWRRDKERPVLGGMMVVGSYYARSFQHQDWWKTSEITEILEDTPNRVRFKTKNSEYTWQTSADVEDHVIK